MAEFILDYLVPPVGGVLDVAERRELDPGTNSVLIPFTFTIPERQIINLNGQNQPTIGHLEFIALMSGPKGGRKKNRPIKMVGLTIGLRDQLLVTGHTGEKDFREVILEDTDPGQVISGAIQWNRAGGGVLVKLSTGQQQSYLTSLNLDRGGRVVLGVDEGSIEGHAKLATWPPSGSHITGRIITGGVGGNSGDVPVPLPRPVDPLPPPLPIPLPQPTPQPVLPPTTVPGPVSGVPSPSPSPGPTSNPPSDPHKIFGLDRDTLADIIHQIEETIRNGGQLDARSILISLAPIVLSELMEEDGDSEIALFVGPLLTLLTRKRGGRR